MDLKELCRKVDRIAILERHEPDTLQYVKYQPIKKRPRSRNTTRYVFCIYLKFNFY